MAFRVPTFNLMCNIAPQTNVGWPMSAIGAVIRLPNVPCALVWGGIRESGSPGNNVASGMPQLIMHLMLPALSDIRGVVQTVAPGDVVEVPAGSGRWYGVGNVDDIGKGYANEHRCALIQHCIPGWPVPIP